MSWHDRHRRCLRAGRWPETGDVREANRNRQVARLEKELSRMKAETEKRQKNRTSIIDRHMQDMLQDHTMQW